MQMNLITLLIRKQMGRKEVFKNLLKLLEYGQRENILLCKEIAIGQSVDIKELLLAYMNNSKKDGNYWNEWKYCRVCLKPVSLGCKCKFRQYLSRKEMIQKYPVEFLDNFDE